MTLIISAAMLDISPVSLIQWSMSMDPRPLNTPTPRPSYWPGAASAMARGEKVAGLVLCALPPVFGL